MTEVRTAFAHLDDLDIMALQSRRQEILEQGDPNIELSERYKSLPDESVTELWMIVRALRRKAASPVKAAAKSKKTSDPNNLEDIA